MRIGSVVSPGFACLAPMAGATDLPFRLLVKELGASVVYTELVSATGLLRGGPGSLRLVRTHPDEHPVGIQLFGGDPCELAEAAALVQSLGIGDLVDLNMGCPVPKVVSLGAGAALMRDPRKVERLVAAVARRVTLPVTAKIRAGWSGSEINAPDVARAIEAGGGQAVAVHARTRSQHHSGAVDLDLVCEVKRAVKIPVLANGGIRCAADAFAMRQATGADAVMIGRGAIEHPWIFREISELERGRTPAAPTVEERIRFVQRHLALARDYLFAGEAETLRALRPQLQRYTAGLPGAASFRRRIERIVTFEECLSAFGEIVSAAAQVSSRASGSPKSAKVMSVASASGSVSA